MNLREWQTSSSKLQERLPPKDLADGVKCKVLGLEWDTQADKLNCVGIQSLSSKSEWTKRTVLSLMSKVFDPLGYFAPITISSKVLLQDLCRRKLKWDEPVAKKTSQVFANLSRELQRIPEVQLPRCLGSLTSQSDPVLVCFCDASTQAYCAAVYLRLPEPEGTEGPKYKASLVYAKARVNPMKEMSMPRLELMAALIGSRALQLVRKSLGSPATSYLFSDSQFVLAWLKSDKPLEKFVANRVKEIKDDRQLQIGYVRTNENPADLGTRGQTIESLTTLWWEGPHWLSDDLDQWPKDNTPALKDEDVAAIASETEPEHSEARQIRNSEVEAPRSPFGISVETYSRYLRLLRVTAYCARFINNIKCSEGERKSSMNLSVNEVKEARVMWDYYIQEQAFSDLKRALKKNRSHPLTNQLGAGLDKKGIIRCFGRLANIDFKERTKFPVLLPSKSKYVELVISHAHEILGHAGVSQTLAQVREDYYIIRGRSAVTRIIRVCIYCRRYDGGPFALPNMPDLPEARVQRSVPFTHTGLDYFGPLYIKTAKERAKVWVALFTCLVTRAIHLELVENMTAEHFIYAFRHFSALRGLPKTILCDNAPQFKVVDSILKRTGDTRGNKRFQDFMTNHGVQFTYISAFSPWKGGV